MPIIRCPACNARFKVAADAGGKHAKCRKCGQSFGIPAFPARATPPDDEPQLSSAGVTPGVDAIELERPPEAITAPESDGELLEAVPLTDIVEYAPGDAAEDAAETRGAYGEYLWSLAKSAAFPARVGDLITFAIVWAALVLSYIAVRSGVCLIAVAAWIITAWYLAFQLRVVLGAAAGDEELPELTVTDGWWDGVVGPFLKMLSTMAIAYLPMFIFLLSTGVASVLGNLSSAGGGLPALLTLLDAKTLIIAGALLLAGGFLWPMLVLMVAVGGYSGLGRVDLIARTIGRSFPAYLLTVAAVYVSLTLQVGFAALIGKLTRTAVGSPQASALGWLLPPLLDLAEVYFTILAMRAIGFYYHHFKHRFAWSWG